MSRTPSGGFRGTANGEEMSPPPDIPMGAFRDAPVEYGEVYGYVLGFKGEEPGGRYGHPSIYWTINEARADRDVINRSASDRGPVAIYEVREVIVE